MSHLSATELKLAGHETLEMLKEAAALSAQAELALNAGDADEVFDLLQRRAALLHSSEAALAVLREASRASGSRRGAESQLLATVVSKARQLESGDARLALALETERDRLARELDQIGNDESVRSAYGKRTRERARINIVR